MQALHVLAAAAFAVAALIALTASKRESGSRARLALTVAGGSVLLGAEKLLRLVDRAHEGLHRVGVPDPPLLEGIDDLFLLAGLAVAAAALAYFARTIAADRWLLAVTAIAAALALSSFAIDAFGPTGGSLTVVEEVLELGVALALAGLALRLWMAGPARTHYGEVHARRVSHPS